jgi:Obg family GTPase CgtA-like protein
MPSVGRSSLIAAMSAARPKIAEYPFTTLVPNLGMVRSGDLSFVLADIPGLIEGASQGKGLGDRFLRHIERSALLLHVLDASGGLEGRDPILDYEIINRELAAYAPELAQRRQIIVINKTDMPETAQQVQRIRTYLEQRHQQAAGSEFAADPPQVFAVSALTKAGIPQLAAATAEAVAELRSHTQAKSGGPGRAWSAAGLLTQSQTKNGKRERLAGESLAQANKAGEKDQAQTAGELAAQPQAQGQGELEGGADTEDTLRQNDQLAVAANQPDPGNFERSWGLRRQVHGSAFEVKALGGGVFNVQGKDVERMVIQTEWDNPEATDHLQRRLEKIGVERELLAAGAKQGDEVRIANRAFGFSPYALVEQLPARGGSGRRRTPKKRSGRPR